MTSPQTAKAASLEKAAIAAGVLVAVAGAGHLAAWLSGMFASGVGATTLTMKANASVCLALAGLALTMVTSDRSAPRLMARACSAIVLAIGFLTLAEHVTGADFGLDQVLATEPPGAAGVTSPNRMGPHAAISFTLLGTALLLLTRRRPANRFPAGHQPLAVVAVIAALVPIIGYLYGVDELYGVARYTAIAWPTAVSLLVLAIGVLCSRPRDGLMAVVTAGDPGGALIRRLLPAAVLLPLALGWIRLAGERGGWFDAGTGTGLMMLLFIVAFSTMFVIGGWWVSRSDTALRQNERDARRRLAEIQAIYDSAHIGLCVFDRDLRYLRINRRLAEINGLAPADHIGRTVEEVLPSIAPLARQVAERILRTGEGATDIEFTGTTAVDPDVQRTWIQQWLPLKDAAGHIVAINVVVEDITERKRAADALSRSEERLRALVRVSSQVIFRMNADWSEMLELAGGSFIADTYEPNANWMQDYIHPEDRALVGEAVSEAVRTGNAFDLEHRVVRLDGTFGWTFSRAVPVRSASGEIIEWFGAASDITARKRAEETRRNTASRLTAALAIAQLGVWEHDVIAAESQVDERCREIFGLADGESLSERDWLEMVHPDDRPGAQRAVAAAIDPRSNGLYDTEYRIMRRDGTERWVAVRGHAIRAAHDTVSPPTRFVGTLMDITDRRRDEQALREANARLAEADRRKDEFIAILSHELRNPLAPIRYALPLLERHGPGDSAARAVGVLRRQVDHLTRLVDDLLDVSRITRGKIELRRQDVMLQSVVTAATEAAWPAVLAGRHTLTTVAADEPIWLHADPTRITQALANLLNNSAKYTPDGGQITLRVERDGGQAVIRVSDNGIGISPEAVPGLFEMFRQARRGARSEGGLGIGLALTKRLVEMHGGSIVARSQGIDRGAEFVVRLPVAATGRDTPAGPPAAPAGSRRLKVLIVDDNADLVEMLGMAVEAAGYEVRTALDGRSAIAAARAYRPDVVLLDLGLPVMSGIEVARELRRDPGFANVMLVAVTGWGQTEDRRRTQEAGFDHHLTKPTNPQHLIELLGQFAGQPEGQRRQQT